MLKRCESQLYKTTYTTTRVEPQSPISWQLLALAALRAQFSKLCPMRLALTSAVAATAVTTMGKAARLAVGQAEAPANAN